MKVITFSNEKGGIGKTTFATHFAGEMARRGKRVLLIDADSQGVASRAMGIRKQPAFYNWAARENEPEGKWKRVLKRVQPDVYGGDEHTELLMIPSNQETRNIALAVSSAVVIKRRLEEAVKLFDYVVFDVSPTPSLLHGNIYLATNYMVLPTTLEQWSLDGVKETLTHIDQHNEYVGLRGFDQIHVAGIVPNMYKAGRQITDITIEHLYQNYDRICTPVRDRETFRKAAMLSKLVTVLESDGEAAEDIRRMIDEVLVVMEASVGH